MSPQQHLSEALPAGVSDYPFVSGCPLSAIFGYDDNKRLIDLLCAGKCTHSFVLLNLYSLFYLSHRTFENKLFFRVHQKLWYKKY